MGGERKMLARLGVLYTSVVLTTVPMLGFDFDSRTSFRRKYLTPMLKNGVLKMTIPEKPSSKNQKNMTS